MDEAVTSWILATRGLLPCGPLGGLLLPSPAGWGAAVCGPAESGPHPGQGATEALADLADGAENASASPPATRHYSWLAFIPKQGATSGAARSLPWVLRKGWPEAGGAAGMVSSCSECSDHIFLS